MKAKKHRFTLDDTVRVIDLGYSIIQSSIFSFEKFIDTQFPNFDLVKLLEEVDLGFKDTTKLNITRQIYYQDTPVKLRILYKNGAVKIKNTLIFDREFSKLHNEIEVNHSYCIIPEMHQKKGLVKRVFQASLQEYVNMRAKKIKVHAGLSGGGHVWARHGFVAVNQSEVRAIVDDAQKRLTILEFKPVKRIFDKYYTDYPGGKAFPIILWAKIDFMKEILRGANWNGEVDLKDNEQFSNFKEYVFRK